MAKVTKPIMLDETGQAIVEALAGIGVDAVKYTAQTKSATEKQIARNNIGATVVSVSNEGTASDEIAYITIDGVEKKIITTKVSVQATGTATDEIKYITIDGVQKKIGDEVFIATVGATTIAEIQTADSAGKTIVGCATSNGIRYYALLARGNNYYEGNVFGGQNFYQGTSFVFYGITWTTVHTTGALYNKTFKYAPVEDGTLPNSSKGTIYIHTTDGRIYIGDGTAAQKVAYTTDVIDNTTSTDTDKPLSANMGKLLQDAINNLKNMGRFLAIWNCLTGLPYSNPTTSPYTYKTGDYYRVGAVADGYHHSIVASGNTTSLGTYSGTYNFAFTLDSMSVSSQLNTIESVIPAMGDTTRYSATGTLTTSDATYTITSVIKWVQDNVGYLALCGDTEEKLALVSASTAQTDTITGGITNYKPSGSSYTIDVPSTAVETEDVQIGWVYYYDGSEWKAQSGGGEGKIVDVQIDGTTIVDSDTGVANIPIASSSTNGAMSIAQVTKLDGVEQNAQVNDIETVQINGTDVAITEKKVNITDGLLSQVKYIAQTLSTAQKEQARNNIGAISGIEVEF